MTIVHTNAPAPDLTAITSLMITSGRAIDALQSNPTAPPSSLYKIPCYCVGTTTAMRAQKAGFRDVHNAEGEGTALAKRILSKKNAATTNILHLAARDTGGTATALLKAEGINVIPWILYAVEPVLQMPDTCRMLLQQNMFDSILLFSPRTGQTWTTLIQNERLETCCASLTAIGISRAVTESVAILPWKALEAASSPTEGAMIERLQNLHPV